MEVAHRYLEHERLNDGGSSFARMPTEAHPGTPISDDDTVAKMGHLDLDVGHCMGERDEETSDVPGKLGNNFGNDVGKGFRPSPG